MIETFSIVGIVVVTVLGFIAFISWLYEVINVCNKRRQEKWLKQQYEEQRKTQLEATVYELKQEKYKLDVLWQERQVKEEKKNVEKRRR